MASRTVLGGPHPTTVDTKLIGWPAVRLPQSPAPVGPGTDPRRPEHKAEHHDDQHRVARKQQRVRRTRIRVLVRRGRLPARLDQLSTRIGQPSTRIGSLSTRLG